MLQNATSTGMLRFRHLLTARTSGQSLAVLRIGFGLIMLGTAWEFFDFGTSSGLPKIEYYYGSPTTNLSYPAMSWLRPLPVDWLTGIFAVIGVFSVFLACGLFTRVAAAIVFLAWTYIFLLDTAYYNNHFYLQSVFAFLLILLPSSSCWSLDNRLRRRDSKERAGRVQPDKTRDSHAAAKPRHGRRKKKKSKGAAASSAP